MASDPKSDFFTEPQTTEPANVDSPAKDIDGIPYCRDHHVRMRRVSGGKKGSATVYYRCPVDSCECKQQIVKVVREVLVPTEPVICPRCKNKNSVCCRDKRTGQLDRSDAYGVILVCQICGWKSNKLPTPQFASMSETRRQTSRSRDTEEIGGR